MSKIKNKRNPWKHFVRKYLNRVEFENFLNKTIKIMKKTGVVKKSIVFKTYMFSILINGKNVSVSNDYYNLGGSYKRKQLVWVVK